jgi:hypothetical protein
MSWVLIYIATNFLAPIPCISLGITDFLFKFPPKLTNFSNSFSNRLKPNYSPEIARPYTNFGPQKSVNRLKLAHRPAKADPYRGQRHPWLASPSTASSTGRLRLPPHHCSKPRPCCSCMYAPPLLSRTCSRRPPSSPTASILSWPSSASPPRSHHRGRPAPPQPSHQLARPASALPTSSLRPVPAAHAHTTASRQLTPALPRLWQHAARLQLGLRPPSLIHAHATRPNRK